MMDEVEAALDDVNLQRFLSLVDEFRDEAQLLDRDPPEAHDGGRRRALRRDDGARARRPRWSASASSAPEEVETA